MIQASNSKHYFRKAGHELFTDPMPMRGQQHGRDYGWGAFGATLLHQGHFDSSERGLSNK